MNDVDHISSTYTKYGFSREPIVINTNICKLTNGYPVLQLVHEWFDGLVTNHPNIVRAVIYSKNGIRGANKLDGGFTMTDADAIIQENVLHKKCPGFVKDAMKLSDEDQKHIGKFIATVCSQFFHAIGCEHVWNVDKV